MQIMIPKKRLISGIVTGRISAKQTKKPGYCEVTRLLKISSLHPAGGPVKLLVQIGEGNLAFGIQLHQHDGIFFDLAGQD